MAFAVALGLSLGAAPQKAFADDPVTQPVVKTVDQSVTATSKTSATSTSVNSVKIDLRTTVLLEYIQSKGATKSQTKGAKTYKLPKAKKLWTSYKRNGKTVWHWKYYGKGHKFYYADPKKTYKLANGKRVKGDGRWHDRPCWNKIALKVKKKGSTKTGTKISTKTKVRIVSIALWKLETKVFVTGKVFVTVEASCKTPNGNSASATATGWASFSASASVSASGSLYASTELTFKGRVKKYIADKKAQALDVNGKAYGDARGSAAASAKAEVKCSDAPPPPPTNQPPSGSMKMPEHLYVGGEYCAKFYGSDPEDKANVEMVRTISGPTVNDPAKFVSETGNCSYRDDIENSQRVITQPIKAGSTPGSVTVTLRVKDSKGLESEPVTFTFPVLADDFPGANPAPKTVTVD